MLFNPQTSILDVWVGRDPKILEMGCS